jgi:hypothetical protein
MFICADAEANIAMGVEIVVIVAEGCPACERLKETIPPDSGVRFLDVTKSEEAVRIASDLGIRAVPTFVAINHEENELCSLDRDFKPKKCVKRVEKPQ